LPQVNKVRNRYSSRIGPAHFSSHGGPGNDIWMDPCLLENLEDADVRRAAGTSTRKG
jgi:hypothetical protein